MRLLRIAFLLVVAFVFAPRVSSAYVQWSAAVTLGGGARLAPEVAREGLFLMGLRADVLFGQRSIRAARVGPFVAVSLLDFEALVAHAGVSVLAPVSTTTPLVFSFGASWDVLEPSGARVPLGVVGRAWWGSRSTNLHASYGMAVGFWLETRWRPDGGVVDLLAGLDGDLAFLSLPMVALWNWITR